VLQVTISYKDQGHGLVYSSDVAFPGLRMCDLNREVFFFYFKGVSLECGR